MVVTFCRSSNITKKRLEKNEEEHACEVFFHIFYYILSLVVISEISLKLTNYVMNEPNRILTSSLKESMRSFVETFNPYGKTLYTILIAIGFLVFYLVTASISATRKEKKIVTSDFGKLLIILIVFLLLSSSYIFWDSDIKIFVFGVLFSFFYIFFLVRYVIIKRISANKFKNKVYFLLFILFLFLTGLFLFLSPRSLYQGDITNFFTFIFEKLLLTLIVFILLSYIITRFYGEEKSLRETIRKVIVDNAKKHPVVMGVSFYSLSLHAILSLFFAETIGPDTGHPYGVLLLLGAAMLISGGFFMFGYIVSRTVERNRGILKSLGVNIEMGKEEILLKKLKEHIISLLLNFVVVISSYVFLGALLEIILSRKPGEILNLFLPILERLNAHLSIILLIPLYIFFFKAGSVVLERGYNRIYVLIKNKLNLPADKKREQSFVDILLLISKAAIIIFIAFDILSRLEKTKIIDFFVLSDPLDDVVKIAVAIPITIWILVLILDPFFEKETVEVGENIGKIKRVGFFFTRMETMTGEQVYIPNAELIAKRIKRLNIRKRSDGKREERGIMVYFSCTLSYSYEPEVVEKRFKNLFREEGENRQNLQGYFSNNDLKIEPEELDYIFSEKSYPFTFIQDFKDHGVVYRFNFRVKNALYAPVLRGYFMDEFKQEMDVAGDPIYTPLKHEITEILPERYEKRRGFM